MGTVIDTFAISKKHNVMQETWGHMYPEPGSKHYGEIVIAVGEYGDSIIVSSDFPGLSCSPQRHELEHSLLVRNFDYGVHQIKCCLWFYKTSGDMYLGSDIGKVININVEQVI